MDQNEVFKKNFELKKKWNVYDMTKLKMKLLAIKPTFVQSYTTHNSTVKFN